MEKEQKNPIIFSSDEKTNNSDEHNMVILIHALSLITGFLGPLIIWLLRKNDSPLIDEQGKDTINFHISFFIYTTISAFSMILLIGFVLFPIVALVYLVLAIVGLISALSKGYYKYPLTIPFLK